MFIDDQGNAIDKEVFKYLYFDVEVTFKSKEILDNLKNNLGKIGIFWKFEFLQYHFKFNQNFNIAGGAFGSLVEILPNIVEDDKQTNLWEKYADFVRDDFIIKVVDFNMSNLQQEIAILNSKELYEKDMVLVFYNKISLFKMSNRPILKIIFM